MIKDTDEIDYLEFVEVLEVINDHNGGIEVSSLLNIVDWNSIESVADLKEELQDVFERSE